MEAFKIALFEQQHLSPFPSFRTLPLEECQHWRERLADRLGLLAAGTALEFACNLASPQTTVPVVNAMDGLTLLPTLAALGITSAPELFLNWARFEAVEAFATADVAGNFDDLWYLAA